MPCKDRGTLYSVKEVLNEIKEISSAVTRKQEFISESRFSIHSQEFKKFILLLQKELLPNFTDSNNCPSMIQFVRNFSSDSLLPWKFDHSNNLKVNYTNNLALANHLRWIAPASKTTHDLVQEPPSNVVVTDSNFKNLKKKSSESMTPAEEMSPSPPSKVVTTTITQNLVELVKSGSVEQSNSQQYSDSSIPVSPPTVDYPIDSPSEYDISQDNPRISSNFAVALPLQKNSTISPAVNTTTTTSIIQEISTPLTQEVPFKTLSECTEMSTLFADKLSRRSSSDSATPEKRKITAERLNFSLKKKKRDDTVETFKAVWSDMKVQEKEANNSKQEVKEVNKCENVKFQQKKQEQMHFEDSEMELSPLNSLLTTMTRINILNEDLKDSRNIVEEEEDEEEEEQEKEERKENYQQQQSENYAELDTNQFFNDSYYSDKEISEQRIEVGSQDTDTQLYKVNSDIRFKSGFKYYMTNTHVKVTKGHPIEYTKKRWNPYDKKNKNKRDESPRKYYNILSVLKYKYLSEVR